MLWNERTEHEYLDIFKALLRINSSNPPGNESEMACYIANKLSAEGIENYIVSKTAGRSNVLAKITGKDPAKKPVMLISHIDVVPAEGWSVPAFEAYERDGMIYGRGSLDTKQLTAGELMAMLLLKRSGKTPDRDVIFVASADEENGSNHGMAYLTANYPEWFPDAYVWSEGGGFIVSDKGKNFRLCAGSEKSTLNVKISVHAGNGGDDLSEQTLYRVTKVLRKLSSYTPPTTITTATERFKKVVDPDKVDDQTIRNLWEYSTKCSMQIDKFDMHMPKEKQNVPVELSVSFKMLPGTDRTDIEALFKTLLENEPVDWEVTDFQQGYESSFDNEFLDVVDKVSKRLDPETEMLPMLILGCTDGRFIGGDVYGYTPALSDTPFSKVLKMVHGKDECLSVASAIYCGRVICESVIAFTTENK